MHVEILLFLLFLFKACDFQNINSLCDNNTASNTVTVCFPKQHKSNLCNVKKRRRVVEDLGWANYYRGWADVQGQGAANDYCRFVGDTHEMQLSCALAGNYDRFNDRNYNSSYHLPIGIDKTWYMKDEDGDGRDDYCRCLANHPIQGKYAIVCTKSGPRGFYGSPEQGGNSLTFMLATMLQCGNTSISPEFGRPIK